jgi:hypothetical protein
MPIDQETKVAAGTQPGGESPAYLDIRYSTGILSEIVH